LASNENSEFHSYLPYFVFIAAASSISTATLFSLLTASDDPFPTSVIKQDKDFLDRHYQPTEPPTRSLPPFAILHQRY
jgi:hypothetical protein